MAEIYDYTTGEIIEETSAENSEESIKDKPKKEWVTDIIGDGYKEWGNEVVLLGIGTGRGKTTFALDVYCKWLTEQGKNVLYLCNRTKLREQMTLKTEELRKELIEKKKHTIGDKTGFLTISTYQSMEQVLWIKEGAYLTIYDVFICDEAHYFLSDSEFNYYTDISYNYLLKRREDATVVMMTATYGQLREQLVSDLGVAPRLYEAPTDYSYVKKIHSYVGKEIYTIIEDILKYTDERILYFCNSLTSMETFYNHYCPSGLKEDEKGTILEDIDFYCSKNRKRTDFYKKHVNKDAIELKRKDREEYYDFSKRVLITTKTLDNGVDFKDTSIKHIICAIRDIESAIQCLGRRRMHDEDDYCYFYLNDYKASDWNTHIRNVNEVLQEPDLFVHDESAWKETFLPIRGRQTNPCIYPDEKGNYYLNRLMYRKLQSDKETFYRYRNGIDSYKLQIIKEIYHIKDLSLIDDDIRRFHYDMTKSSVLEFLEEHVGQLLTDDEKEEFILLCGIWNEDKELIRGSIRISKYLSDYYGYRIDKKRRADGSYAWKIVRKNAPKEKKKSKEDVRRKMRKKKSKK